MKEKIKRYDEKKDTKTAVFPPGKREKKKKHRVQLTPAGLAVGWRCRKITWLKNNIYIHIYILKKRKAIYTEDKKKKTQDVFLSTHKPITNVTRYITKDTRQRKNENGKQHSRKREK